MTKNQVELKTALDDSKVEFEGNNVLHLLVGLWWDEVRNEWDRSQLLPSQTPTNHPSGFI